MESARRTPKRDGALALLVGIKNGPPERIRTSDLPLRRGPRYPAVPPGRKTFLGENRSISTLVNRSTFSSKEERRLY